VLQSYYSKRPNAIPVRTPEHKFLHLSLFLSQSLKCEKETLVEVFAKAMSRLKIDMTPSELKSFNAFLKDGEGKREKAACLALNRLFQADIQKTLEEISQTPLAKELYALSLEDLEVSNERVLNNTPLYTYPKLAGVAYFVDQIAKDNIPFVFKVKVLTPEGSAGVLVCPSREIRYDELAIVFEAYAIVGNDNVDFTADSCRNAARRCNQYFLRFPSKESRHKPDETCFYCKTTEIDLSELREKITDAVESYKKTLYALGADFIDKEQPGFKPFFQDVSRYPELSGIYSQSQSRFDLFSMCHAYPEVGLRAKSDKFQLEMIQKYFLKLMGAL
jgi:hypothetical protein